MLCLSGFELYPRWVPLSPQGAHERAVPAGACCCFLTSLTSFRDSRNTESLLAGCIEG